MQPAAAFHGLQFDIFPPRQHGWTAAEVDVGQGQVVETFVVAARVVVIDELGGTNDRKLNQQRVVRRRWHYRRAANVRGCGHALRVVRSETSKLLVSLAEPHSDPTGRKIRHRGPCVCLRITWCATCSMIYAAFNIERSPPQIKRSLPLVKSRSPHYLTSS